MLERYFQQNDICLISSNKDMRLVQLKNLKLVEIQIIGDGTYNAQEVTRNISGDCSKGIDLDGLTRNIQSLELRESN